MKRRLINAVCILLLLSSAVFLLMPHVSREITKKDMDDKISRFETAVSNTETLPDEDDETASDSQNSPSGEVYSEEGVTTPIDVNKLYEDSKAYNKALADHQDILAVLFFVKVGTAYFDYRKHGQFEFAAPAILFACLIFSLTAPLYIWSVL